MINNNNNNSNDNSNNNTQFEVFKPNGYTYDVLGKPYSDSLSSTSGYMILSHYGFYKGNTNESKIKNGRGTFLFSNSIYSGQWISDKKEGDGTLVILKQNSNLNSNNNNKKKKQNKKPIINNSKQQIISNNKLNNTTPKKLSVSPNNLSPKLQPQISNNNNNTLFENDKFIINKFTDKFNQCEELVKQVSNSDFLKQQDYYRGKFISGKANGIGSFHFSGDDSNHVDFWRCGVIIRYANQQNILKPINEDSIPQGLLNSKEILKEMIEDWKKVIGPDDCDFPCARPYLSTPTTSISLQQQQNSTTPPLLSPTHIPLSPPKGLIQNNLLTPISSSDSIEYNSLQHSKTSPNVSISSTSSPSNNNNNKLIELINLQRNQQKILKKQLIKLSGDKQSFGIITANYLKNRLENEEKFFITLILFISKWEIPFKSFNIPNNPSTHASFLIFVPDTDNCTFISLSNLIMQSNILEKLISKLLIDPISKIIPNNNNNHNNIIDSHSSKSTNSTPNNISPSTSLNSVTSSSLTMINLPSSTPEERELHKLLPICLDLDDIPSIEKESISTILHLFKLFPVIEDYQTPQFIPDQICNLISCFKKTKSLENYLLQKQFQMSKDYFFKVTPPPLQQPSSTTTTTTTTTTASTTTTIVSGFKTLKKTKNSTQIINKEKETSILPSISVSSNNNTPNITSPTVTSPPSIKPTFSVSLTISNKIDISTSNPNGSGGIGSNTVKYGTMINNGPRRQTLESVFPTFKQHSNTDLLSSLMQSTSIHQLNNKYITQDQSNQLLQPPELTIQSVNILFNQFKQSYQFPDSLNKSLSYLNSISQSLDPMKKVIKSKINSIIESCTKPSPSSPSNFNSSFKNYLNSHDNLIESIINGLKNDLQQLDNSFEVCLKLFKELTNQQINLLLKRLKLAHDFINQLINLPNSRTSKIPKDFIIRFIKHTHKIVYQVLKLLNTTSTSIIKFDTETKKDIEEFINQSSDLFSKLPSNIITGVSPSPTYQSPQLSSIPTSVYEYFVGKKNRDGNLSPNSSSLSLSPPSVVNSNINPLSLSGNSLSIGQQSNNYIRSNSMDRASIEFESSDITPGPFSFISPLDKITEEIMSGHYQLILPIASSGDELLVSVLSNGLIDLRQFLSTDNRLRDINKSSLIQLFNILLHSTIICHNQSINLYIPEVFKTLILLLPFYPKKDELFLRYKEVFIGFMELCIRDESYGFSFIYLTFLGLLIKPKKKGLRKELKKEFVELFPIQLFIDLMERQPILVTSHHDNNYNSILLKNSEKTKAQAAQILINLSISSIDYLIEIKNKNALGMILDICKFGQAFAHTQIEENELIIGEFLGEGALARVHKGVWKGKEIAIKIFNEGSFSFRLEDFLKEVAILGLISHPNLLKLKGACIAQRSSSKSTFMIVTELMHKGTLLEVIEKNKPLSIHDIIKHSLSVAQGLAYLHSIDFIHRDIKAANILVDKENNAKVGDFGMSRVIDNFNMTAVAGTPKWESPECLMGEVYTSASDVYSFGMMLFELATGEEPFLEIQSIVELVRSVCDKKLKPKIPSSCPNFISSLIKDCLSHSPKKRPTMSQIIQKLIHESKNLK